LAELNRVLWVLAEDHRALVADVHAWFLGHGLAAGDPTPAGRSPPQSWPVVLPPDRAQCLGASEIRASFWEAPQRAGTEWS
jgi:hypothetical protein